MKSFSENGFTLIELMLVVAIIGITAALIIFYINPVQQFASARNTQRSSDLATILSAVSQNMADNKGTFNCSSGAIPTSSEKMASSGTSTYNIVPCLVPNYLPILPHDPSAGGAHYAGTADYDAGYAIVQDATSGRITVNAPSAELGKTISITR